MYNRKLIDGCKNNPEISSTTKVSEYILSGFSMSIISPFKNIENKNELYGSKDCIKKFCESLRKHTMRIINFEKKKLKLLTKEQLESYANAKISYICKKTLKINIWKIRNIVMLESIVISIPKNISIAFNNGF